jgi:hypothetical protein
MTKVIHVITNDPFGPFGAKEASEGSTCTAAPAVINAIHHATGVWIKDLPAKPEKVFWVLKEKKEKSLLGIYGTEATLLVGDALLIGGLSKLYKLKETIPKNRFDEIVETIKDGLFELGSAEMEELKLIRNLQVTPKKYLQIVHMKAADVGLSVNNAVDIAKESADIIMVKLSCMIVWLMSRILRSPRPASRSPLL